MAYQPYGSQSPIWSAQEYTPWSPPGNDFANLAIGAGLLGAGFFGSRAVQIGQGKTAFDLVQSHVRAGAERSPFAVLNTFRVAEFMSPFTSGAAKNLATGASVLDASKNVSFYEYGAEFVSSKETKEYLKTILSKEAYESAGMHLPGDFQLRYEQSSAEGSTGKLLGRRVEPKLGGPEPVGGWKTLSNKVGLFETAPYEANIIKDAAIEGRYSQHKGINTAFYSILQTFGLTEQWGIGAQTKADRLFAVHDSDGKFKYRTAYAPIPLEAGRGMNAKQLGAAYAQAPLAFGMERFNRLIQQIPFMDDLSKTLADKLGFRMGVQSGKPLNMFMRYGGRAAQLGALYMGVQQADWARRNYGIAGDVVVAGGVSAGAAYLFNKVKKSGSPRGAFAVGLATFFGQQVLPGFDQGIIPGIATTATKLHIAKSAIGAVTGMNHYRRTLEGLFPGISDWKTGALAGVALSIATMPDFMTRGGLPGMVFRRMGPEARRQIGLGQSMINAQFNQLPKSFSTTHGEVLWDIMFSGKVEEEGPLKAFLSDQKGAPRFDREHVKDVLGISEPADLSTRMKRSRLHGYLYNQALRQGGAPYADDLMRELHFNYEMSVKKHRERWQNDNIVNKALSEKLSEIDTDFRNRPATFSNRLAKGVSGFRAKFTHAVFGASLTGESLLGPEGAFAKHGFNNRLGRVGTIFAGAFGLHQLLTGALFGSMEGPSELSAIYSGQKMVEVKRGRWWEGGGTPFEGADIKYHRPHAYVAMMTRSRQKAAWGSNEDEISPIRKFFLKNFTYYLEESNYYSRPYPLTGAAFEDVPIIGRLLAATIGRVVKPAKLMHTGEYMRPGPDGSIEFLHKPEINGPEYSLGGTSPGVPYSPFSAGYVAGEMQYQFRELEGLTGWAKNMMQKSATGLENFGTQRPVMASAGSMTDPGEAFWDMNLGGGFFMTEAVRRFLPRKRSEIEEYNPLTNRMPHWLPDRFKYGDPYRSIEAGHLRLPGSGYEAIRPELKGMSMEEYPDIYKYAILADVAAQSKEFRRLRQNMYRRRSQGITTESENALMDATDRLYNERITTDFDRVHPNALELPLISNVTQSIQERAQKFVRKGIAPVEYMIPGGFRPTQKLMSDRDPIEEYEYKRLYGSQFAFWDKPIRDWFRPAFYSSANFMGYEGKPGWRVEADKQQEYFDRLEFQKQMLLAQRAGAQGDNRTKRMHLARANKTRYGVNPQANAMSIYMTLPESEKQFFDAFSMASERERERILEMIPSDQAHLYKAIWSRVDSGDPTLYVGSNTAVSEQYLNRKFHNLEDYNYNNPMPQEDWIGWHEDVNIDDIELRYNDSLGKDLHEYGFWHSQRRQLARKDYLEGSDQYLHNVPGPDPFSVAGQLYGAGRNGFQIRAPNQTSVHSSQSFYTRGHGSFYMNDDRSTEISSGLMSMLRGY